MPNLVLPRENLIRAAWPGVRLIGQPADPDDDGEQLAARSLERGDPFAAEAKPGITGHFAVFNRWTEINSWFEGHFLERIAPGAARKTMRENRAGMRCLFQHGRDGLIGDKPLGPIDVLEEDSFGCRYEVELLDTSYNRDLIPGLQAGLYGASFRFNVVREDIVQEPARSDYNPDGIPERTIREMRVSEFGPVTFPAYADATAGMRSLTDEFLAARFREDPDRVLQLVRSAGLTVEQLADLADALRGHTETPAPTGTGSTTPDNAPPDDAAQTGTSDGRREAEPPAAQDIRPLVVIRNPRRHRKVVPLS